jgi:hypothetical protein
MLNFDFDSEHNLMEDSLSVGDQDIDNYANNSFG